MPFVTLPDGVKMYYEVEGAGEPLLMLMGRASDHYGWGRLPHDFAARREVIVFDWRGTGQSDKPESPPYTVQGFANDAAALLDHLGLARAQVYGISMGGRVAQWLAIEHAARVGALVLGCTTPGDAHGVPRSPRVDAIFNGRNPLRLLPLFWSPLWMLTHLNALAAMRPPLDVPVPPYAQALHRDASEAHDSWDRLPSITAPTLVIHGDQDPVCPVANAHLLAERIPGAELHIVRGGRHIFYLQFREEVERVVEEFLNQHLL
jgi:pimeloyl-ACP methyl ester carboxylesterase